MLINHPCIKFEYYSQPVSDNDPCKQLIPQTHTNNLLPSHSSSLTIRHARTACIKSVQKHSHLITFGPRSPGWSDKIWLNSSKADRRNFLLSLWSIPLKEKDLKKWIILSQESKYQYLWKERAAYIVCRFNRHFALWNITFCLQRKCISMCPYVLKEKVSHNGWEQEKVGRDKQCGCNSPDPKLWRG